MERGWIVKEQRECGRKIEQNYSSSLFIYKIVIHGYATAYVVTSLCKIRGTWVRVTGEGESDGI